MDTSEQVLRQLKWIKWLMALIAPFVPTVHEMREMRYLWTTRVEMRNAKLVATLGHEPHTPHDTAVEAALDGMGCLPAKQVRQVDFAGYTA